MVNNDGVKIYKISSDKCDKCYVGSTRDMLYRRKAFHKGNYKKYCEGRNTYCSSFEILDIDWNAEFSIIEEVKLEERKEKERYWIRKLNTVNKKRFQTHSEKCAKRREYYAKRKLAKMAQLKK